MKSESIVVGEAILTLPDVLDRVPKSVATIYRWMKAGRFPRSVQLGPNSVGWRASDVDRFIAELPNTSTRTGARPGSSKKY